MAIASASTPTTQPLLLKAGTLRFRCHPRSSAATVTATAATESETTTEHVLATIAAAGTYQLVVDTSNMVFGDTVELRIKVKVRTGSTAKEVFYSAYSGAQGDDVIKLSPPTPAPFQLIATLKQTVGTSRNFDRSIYEY